MNANDLLTELRSVANRNPYTHSSDSSRHLASLFADLDSHLSAGGTPPEAWREGPDAPIGHSEAIIRAAEVLGMDPAELTERLMAEPSPAGMVQDEVYARDDDADTPDHSPAGMVQDEAYARDDAR